MENYFIIPARGNGKHLQTNPSADICEYCIKQLPKNSQSGFYWKTDIVKYIQNHMRP